MKTIIPNDAPNATDYPGFVLWQKSNNWERYINDLLKPFSISQSEILQLISIITLLRSQDEVTQIELVALTGVTPMHTSKILIKLEKNNLISRKVATDSRAKALRVTEKGLKLLFATAPILQDANKNFFPKENLEIFNTYLNKIKLYAKSNNQLLTNNNH
jgi:DNA-binding MarR family transcriptional regulator